MGGSCPSPAYAYGSTCCCGDYCCWMRCLWNSPPTNCLVGVPQAEWKWNQQLGYNQAILTSGEMFNQTSKRVISTDQMIRYLSIKIGEIFRYYKAIWLNPSQPHEASPISMLNFLIIWLLLKGVKLIIHPSLVLLAKDSSNPLASYPQYYKLFLCKTHEDRFQLLFARFRAKRC